MHNVTLYILFYTFCKEYFLDDDDSGLLLGQSASGLNVYDDSGRISLAK